MEWKNIVKDIAISFQKINFFLLSAVQAGDGGVTVWGMFSLHTSGPIIPMVWILQAWNINADHECLGYHKLQIL